MTDNLDLDIPVLDCSNNYLHEKGRCIFKYCFSSRYGTDTITPPTDNSFDKDNTCPYFNQ